MSDRLGFGLTHQAAPTRPLAGAHPANPDAGGRADAVDQLRGMVLDVTDIDELMLQLGHAVPTEAALGTVEIQRVHGVIDHPIAELAVLEHLRLRVRFTRDAVVLAAMLFPQPERSFVALKIQVCKEQSVIRHLPERILVVGAQPLLGRAALDGFAEHRQRRMILAFQHGSKHRMRVVHRLDCTRGGVHRHLSGYGHESRIVRSTFLAGYEPPWNSLVGHEAALTMWCSAGE